jgi:hypothetical protein
MVMQSVMLLLGCTSATLWVRGLTLLLRSSLLTPLLSAYLASHSLRLLSQVAVSGDACSLSLLQNDEQQLQWQVCD